MDTMCANTPKMVDEFELGNAEILSLSAQLRQNGMEVSRHTISLQKMAVPQWLSDSFPEEQEVYELIRLSEVNDESYVLQKAYLPYSKFEDMDRFNFEQFSLYAYMEDKGYRPKNMVSMMHIGLCQNKYKNGWIYQGKMFLSLMIKAMPKIKIWLSTPFRITIRNIHRFAI